MNGRNYGLVMGSGVAGALVAEPSAGLGLETPLSQAFAGDTRENINFAKSVGGGIAGLACAHRAVELATERGMDLDLVLLEARERLGGTIHTERLGFKAFDGPCDVKFSADGKRILVTGAPMERGKAGAASIWDAATGKPIGPPLRHQEGICAAAFGPDGETVLTGSHDHTAQLWDAATLKPIGTPLQHQDYVWAVAFSPDGKTLVTASKDHTARLWDAVTLKPIGPRGLRGKLCRVQVWR